MKEDRPNIVLIMSDEHHSRFMGCAGNSIIQTPALDMLASQGTRFNNAYCAYPLCGPSRAAFLTGQYPSQLGIYDGEELSSHVPTFAHSLNMAGYHTALCGRMGWWWGPDQFYGFQQRLHGDAIPVDNVLTAELKGSGFNKTSGQTRYAVQVSGYGRQGNQLFDQSVTDTACTFIQSQFESSEPCCLVVGLMLPHCPLICQKEQFDYYMQRIEPPRPVSKEYLETLHPAMKRWRQCREMDEISSVQHQRALAAYYGLVTEMDSSVGRIIEAVKQSSQAERTVIIYTSDHGDMAGEQGMWWKSNFYDASSRVPLIISCPGQFSQEQMIDSIVSLIDIGPTMLDIAGAQPLPHVEGRSLRRFVGGGQEPVDWPNEIYCEYRGLQLDQPAYMVRSGPWKLNYYHGFHSCQLFNLEDDPQEINDLGRDQAYKDVVGRLYERIEARWSGDEYLAAAKAQAQQRRFLLDGAAGGAPHVIPHPVTHFSAPPGYNQFDYSQLPEPPSPRR